MLRNTEYFAARNAVKFRAVFTSVSLNFILLVKMASASGCVNVFPWKEDELLLLLSHTVIPKSWDPNNYPLTYFFLYLLFEMCEKVQERKMF